MYLTGTFNNFKNRLHLAATTGDLFTGYLPEGRFYYTGGTVTHYSGLAKQWNVEFLKQWSMMLNSGQTGSYVGPYIPPSGLYF